MLVAAIRTRAPQAARIGLESGPLSPWHWHALRQDGLLWCAWMHGRPHLAMPGPATADLPVRGCRHHTAPALPLVSRAGASGMRPGQKQGEIRYQAESCPWREEAFAIARALLRFGFTRSNDCVVDITRSMLPTPLCGGFRPTGERTMIQRG